MTDSTRETFAYHIKEAERRGYGVPPRVNSDMLAAYDKVRSDYAALEAECERLRVNAGDLVVAQYATSAAIARAEALEARLAEVVKAGRALSEILHIMAHDSRMVSGEPIVLQALKAIEGWERSSALARGDKADG
ncbi:hypothetical protein QBK99_11265 [Corticibacterium sp. UT-5YL-CI-8]|nr:hypothetical protein [Tianweitania sp. UT-5YL-CI-8]